MSPMLLTDPDGTCEGLVIVGAHGHVGPEQTPARRAPVYADRDGRMACIDGAEPQADGRVALTVEFASQPIPGEVWGSTGTAIDPPWPFILGKSVLIIGERELCNVDELIEPTAGPFSWALIDESTRVRVNDFLRWAYSGSPRCDRLHSVRLGGGLVTWLCTPAEIAEFKARLAKIARRKLSHAVRIGDPHWIRSASYWLSRSAACDDDIGYAVRALRSVGEPNTEALIAAMEVKALAKAIDMYDEGRWG